MTRFPWWLLLLVACAADPAISPDPVDEEACPSNRWPPCPEREWPPNHGWEVGEIAYRFRATDQFGQDADLRQFAGSMVLMEVGATWCGPCRVDAEYAQEMVDLIHEEYGFPFWRVQVLADRTNQGAYFASAWAEAYDLEFPCVAGVRAVHAAGNLRVDAYPTFFILDPDLRIRDRFSGSPGPAALIQLVANHWEDYQREQEAP